MPTPKGRLATTTKGRRGRRRRRASAGNDAHVGDVFEAVAQVVDQAPVDLDGHHGRAGGGEGRGEGAGAGADVEDEVARADSGVSDQPLGPRRAQPVLTERRAAVRVRPRRAGRGASGGPGHAKRVTTSAPMRSSSPRWRRCAREYPHARGGSTRYRWPRNVDGADRFRHQFRWPSVRPELLRLVKRGKPTTANEQYAVAA